MTLLAAALAGRHAQLGCSYSWPMESAMITTTEKAVLLVREVSSNCQFRWALADLVAGLVMPREFRVKYYI